MCGIIGYIGKNQAWPILIEGLKKLEYRGYDSFGFCLLDEKNQPFVYKKAAKISEAEKELEKIKIQSHIGLGHTRWATTGEVSDKNAHPHSDCHKQIFVVHNGIVENYQALREKLIKEGHRFSSECDSEVFAHLIEKYFKGDLLAAVLKALDEVRGAYALAVLSNLEPNKLIAARLSSPLILGLKKGEFFLASDPSAIISYTNKVIPLEDNEIAVLEPNRYAILKGKKQHRKKINVLDWSPDDVSKGSYPHFMLKEIMEEPEAVSKTLAGRILPSKGIIKLGGLELVKEKLNQIDYFYLISCGTAQHAAKIGEYLFEEWGGIKAKAMTASEFRYLEPVLTERTAALFISQSGETADNLAALRYLKKKGILTLGITNVVGSTQARETDAGIYTRCGLEIAVGSTKAFLSQLAVLVMLALYLSKKEWPLTEKKKILEELEHLPEKISEILKSSAAIENLAKKYKHFNHFYLIGRKYNFPVALEGALKLKEIAYVHAEGMPAGELKHGPLALVDKNLPTIALCPSDSVYDKMFIALEEIKSRQGVILAIANSHRQEIKKIADDVIFIPATLEPLSPILSVVPLQLFSYYLAKQLGREIDKPRNLAKSVTVE